MTKPFKWSERQLAAQAVLASQARYILGEGGARSGKTFLICYAIACRALVAPGSRHLIGRLHFNHAKATILHQTWPTMMRMCLPDYPWKVNKQDWIIELGEDSTIWIGGFDDNERMEKILGAEYVTIFANEGSQLKWSHIEILSTRLAQVVDQVFHDPEGNVVEARPLVQRFYIDLNPPLESHWGHKLFHQKRSPEPPFDSLPDSHNYGLFQINPEDNKENLDPKFLESMDRLPARARLRFYEGKWGSATENALWTSELIERCRVQKHPDLQRIVIAVDPSGTKGPEDDQRTDMVGIIVVGLGIDGYAYVLEDLTQQTRPLIWGKNVVAAFARYEADMIVAETNYGGAMVGDTVRAAASEMKIRVNFREVTSSRGKVLRAEPISALYGHVDPSNPLNFTRSKVFHVGNFTELEDQMLNFTTAGYMGDRSPDRADALVFALTEMFPGLTRKASKGPLVVEGIGGFNPLQY